MNPQRFNAAGDPNDPKTKFSAIEIEKIYIDEVISNFIQDIKLSDIEG